MRPNIGIRRWCCYILYKPTVFPVTVFPGCRLYKFEHGRGRGTDTDRTSTQNSHKIWQRGTFPQVCFFGGLLKVTALKQSENNVKLLCSLSPFHSVALSTVSLVELESWTLNRAFANSNQQTLKCRFNYNKKSYSTSKLNSAKPALSRFTLLARGWRKILASMFYRHVPYF